jgi:membrane protease subunit HflK
MYSNQPETPLQFLIQYKKTILIVIFALFALTVVLDGTYTVDTQEQAVVTRFGKYLTTTDPGLHFKIPFVDDTYLIKVEKQYTQEFGFRKNNLRRSEGPKNNIPKESWMLTGDLSIAEVRWVIQYRITDPAAYLFNFRRPEEFMRDLSEMDMRTLVGDRSFHEATQRDRAAMSVEATNNMYKYMTKYNMGLEVNNVQIHESLPPQPVMASYNDVNVAKQEQETLINEARQQYNKIILEVKGQAKAKINDAKGYAAQRVNNAKGDVAAFMKLEAEYLKAPEITKQRLYLEAMDNILAGAVIKVVDEDLQSILPHLSLDGGR